MAVRFLRHEIEKGTESGLRVSPRQTSNINTDSEEDFSYKTHIRMQILESAPFDLENIHCFKIRVNRHSHEYYQQNPHHICHQSPATSVQIFDKEPDFKRKLWLAMVSTEQFVTS